MAKKRKTKKEIPEDESYEIEIEDWEEAFRFGMNTLSKDLIEGVYWEHSKLILLGKILSPDLEKAGKARIELSSEPQLDDHWTSKPTIISAKAIGWMEIPRGDDTLIFYCSVPSHFFLSINVAVQAEKIKHASISGTKLKWRKGTIESIYFSTNLEEQ